MAYVSKLPMGGREYFKIAFSGHFDDTEAHRVIHALREQGIEGVERVSMIWDCSEMRNYENSAREVWQHYFELNKSKIDVVHLVSDDILIRTAARAMGIFWKVKISVWPNYSDFEQSLH